MDKELIYYISGVILLALATLILLSLHSQKKYKIHRHKEDSYKENNFHVFYPSKAEFDATEKLDNKYQDYDTSLKVDVNNSSVNIIFNTPSMKSKGGKNKFNAFSFERA